MLVQETVEGRSEIGDFIAYYTFDEGSGDTLIDRSGTDNGGRLKGDPRWNGDFLRFDGSGDYVQVNDIQAPDGVEVSEFTVAIAFNERNNNGIGKLFEHNYNDYNNEWYMELKGSRNLKYTVTSYPDTVGVGGFTQNERYVAVGVYDGSEFTLYANGQQRGSSATLDVNLGDMNIGAETDPAGKYFNGDIYEMRLYYHAFDADEVEVITNAME